MSGVGVRGFGKKAGAVFVKIWTFGVCAWEVKVWAWEVKEPCSLWAVGSLETDRLPSLAMSGFAGLAMFLEEKFCVLWNSKFASASCVTVARLRYKPCLTNHSCSMNSFAEMRASWSVARALLMRSCASAGMTWGMSNLPFCVSGGYQDVQLHELHFLAAVFHAERSEGRVAREQLESEHAERPHV